MTELPELSAGSGLPFRNAFEDYRPFPSRVVVEGTDGSAPFVTVAITIYKRFKYLPDLIEKLLNQPFDRPVEIIVVDDDPDSDFGPRLVELLPMLKERRFRYIVNSKNLGVNGTFNRCIEFARGEWLTILNDDDLLDDAYLEAMFAYLDAHPAIDAIASRKRDLDERGAQSQRPLPPVRRLASRLLTETLFLGRTTRRVTPRKMFWWPGGVIGNVAGVLMRTSVARDIGGFYPEDGEGSADYWFLTRLTKRFKVRQHRQVAAVVRIAENESAKVSTLKTFFLATYGLQQALAGDGVPRGWARFSPLIIGQQRAFYRDYWHIDIPREEVGKLLGIRVSPERPILFRLVRILFRGL